MRVDGREQLSHPLGSMLLSVEVPSTIVEIDEHASDPRPIAFAYRTRTAIAELATACFSRGLQLLIHADQQILPTVSYIARSFPPFRHGAARIVAAANAGDSDAVTFANRAGGTVELASVPQGVTADESRFERFDRLLRWNAIRCVFFVGGTANDVVQDGALAIRRGTRNCFALASTGPGARQLLNANGSRMTGDQPGLDGELRDTVSSAFAISICLAQAGL